MLSKLLQKQSQKLDVHQMHHTGPAWEARATGRCLGQQYRVKCALPIPPGCGLTSRSDHIQARHSRYRQSQ